MSDPFQHRSSPNAPPFQPDEDVITWLRGKTPAELNAIEVIERDAVVPTSLFPDVIRYRNGRGEPCEVAVLLKIPTEPDFVTATADAVKFVAHAHKGKEVETPDQAKALVGALRFENLDTAAIVALCARDPKPPHGRLYLLHVLAQSFPPSSIADAFERLEMLRRAWDVRVGELTEVQFWAFTAEIARVRNIGPLAALAPALQGAFITRQAVELRALRTLVSSAGSN